VNSIVLPSEITKNKQERFIPLPKRTIEATRIMYAWWWKDIAPGAEGFAFYNSDNTKHISKRTIHYIISRASMKSIGRTIHPHVLRHTFATRMMFVTNLRVVQQLLGHKNLSSTQIYTHPKREDLQNAVAQLE
jgi:site-specific recombinase XerD